MIYCSKASFFLFSIETSLPHRQPPQPLLSAHHYQTSHHCTLNSQPLHRCTITSPSHQRTQTLLPPSLTPPGIPTPSCIWFSFFLLLPHSHWQGHRLPFGATTTPQRHPMATTPPTSETKKEGKKRKDSSPPPIVLTKQPSNT